MRKRVKTRGRYCLMCKGLHKWNRKEEAGLKEWEREREEIKKKWSK